jgi:outer membrane protein TolC
MKKSFGLILLITLLFSFPIKAENKTDKISLKEAIYQALENNLDLKIEKTNLEYSNETLKIDDSIFIPKFTVDASSTERNRPTTDIFGGADIQKNESFSLNLGLEQKIALGGTLNISLYNSRSKTNNAFSTINPNEI